MNRKLAGRFRSNVSVNDRMTHTDGTAAASSGFGVLLGGFQLIQNIVSDSSGLGYALSTLIFIQ
jgi:hypothetical protein